MRFWTKRLPFLRAFAKTKDVLHFGAGVGERFGKTVDVSAVGKPDFLVDLNRFPYPFGTSSVDAIYAFSIIEHLPDFFGVFSEVHRILRPNGFIAILTPHFSNAGSFIDPTHVLHLSARSFDYFIPGTELCRQYGFYTKARFRARQQCLMLEAPWRYLPGAQALCTMYPRPFEQHLCYLLRAQGIYVELEAIKESPASQ